MNLPTFSVSFKPIEYRALLTILDEVGLRVQGAGPKTDALRVMIPSTAKDGGATKINLGLSEIEALLAVARIADGINELDLAQIVGENPTVQKYPHMNGAKAVLQTLEAAVTKTIGAKK